MLWSQPSRSLRRLWLDDRRTKATGSSELSQKQWKKPGGGKCPDEQDKTLSRVDVIEVSVAAASAQHMGATPTIHKAGREISGMSLLSYTWSYRCTASTCFSINATNQWYYNCSPALHGEQGTRFFIEATGRGVRWTCRTIRDLCVLGHAVTMPPSTDPNWPITKHYCE